MWIIIAILAYFIFAAVSLTDKHLLTRSIPNPKVYTFYVGALGILALGLAPFVGFYIPEFSKMLLGILTGAVFVISVFWLYKGLSIYETSRIIPAIGGLAPLFTFLFVFIFSLGQETLSGRQIVAFLLLILGSVLITSKKGEFFHKEGFRLYVVAACLMSLYFVLAKYLYLALPFWTAFIWRCIGSFLAAVFLFLVFPEIKKEIFKKQEKMPLGPGIIFLGNQAFGGVATVLQNWAVALAPLSLVAFINALQGIQYVFLLIFSVFLSVKFPRFLKEETSGGVIFQKIIAVLVIGVGLAILTINI